MPFVSILRTYLRDIVASVRLGADLHSRLQLITDYTLSRFIGVMPGLRRNQRREVRLQSGITILYRLNKGDLHSIREIWFEEDYWLPFENSSGVLLDLGANIGMASLWLSKRYGFNKVIAVEPDPTNAELLRENFRLNAINGEVLEAAIGPQEGTARFQVSQLSNLGKLSEDGSLVQMTSVDAVVEKFSLERFALVKIDIEGGEQQLFGGSTAWLSRTDAIIMELHPTVDCGRLIELVRSRGFKHIPAHSLFPDNLPCFVMNAGTAEQHPNSGTG